MFPDSFSRSTARRGRGSALIITLSALVLITVAVLIFFDQSLLNRQIAFSSSGQYRADVIAHTGVDTILGDLRTEIVAGSGDQTLYTDPATGVATHLYTPTTSVTTVPCRVGDQNFPNVVKQSTKLLPAWANPTGSASPVYNAAITAPVRSADNNTTQPSLNGRAIAITRWNKAGLLGDPGAGNLPALPTASPLYANAPDWVVVTRQGAIADVTNATAMNISATLANKNSNGYAVGRYAYVIYNEGALLDVNVAGFPGSLSGTTFATERGLLPQVDLNNLVTSTGMKLLPNASSFVQWRNQATAASYSTYVPAATNGFTTVAPGDQALVSRKDLLDYIQANPSQVSTAALPYLGTSSLDSDQPSFYPDPGRPSPDNVTNPKIAAIRVQTAFPRADGTTAVVGEALVKHRFPLSRIALFSNQGGSGNLDKIKQYFCMVPNTTTAPGTWDYFDPDAKAVMTTLPTIKTLDQVASAGREATYWELLQATVLTGSVGMDTAGPAGCQTSQNQSTARQIFTLGLSIIDQYDSDDNPTVINLAGINESIVVGSMNQPLIGIENLPYFFWAAENGFYDTVGAFPAPPAGQQSVCGYFIPAFWNPHRNAIIPSTGSSTGANASPGVYRMRIKGSTYVAMDINVAPNVVNSPSFNHDSSFSTLVFQTSAGRDFSSVDILRASDIVSASSDMAFRNPAGTILEPGVFMGNTSIPANSLTHISLAWNQPMGIIMEKQVGANWVPYQIIPRFNGAHSNANVDVDQITTEMSTGKFDAGGASPVPVIINVAHSDPRTTRFGFVFGADTPVIRSLQNSFNLIYSQHPPNTSIPGFGSLDATGVSAATAPADYAYNQAAYATGTGGTYNDRDGVTRKGDSNPTSTKHQMDSPYYAAGGNADPIMLNRAFTSVAEMGYAFRDSPWRTLNFSSKDSADGGLLDLFCLYENDNANRAGVVDINGASAPVLQALLTNIYQDPSSTALNPMSAAQASTIATAIRTQLGPPNAPKLVLRNVADLPLLIDNVAASLNTLSPNPFEFKFNREAAARSLADVTNTRTWNLLIDVVAQSGRYTPISKNLNNFVVEGERRYWVHVALDRFTGKVLRTQAEPVVE